jgi:hypothetical protein
MKVMTKLRAAAILASFACCGPITASGWWDDDDYDDRWYGGPWYGYPGYGYGWGGYPGYGWGGYPGYGWGGYPGWGYPGHRSPSTIIVNPAKTDSAPRPEPQLPR